MAAAAGYCGIGEEAPERDTRQTVRLTADIGHRLRVVAGRRHRTTPGQIAAMVEAEEIALGIMPPGQGGR